MTLKLSHLPGSCYIHTHNLQCIFKYGLCKPFLRMIPEVRSITTLHAHMTATDCRRVDQQAFFPHVPEAINATVRIEACVEFVCETVYSLPAHIRVNLPRRLSWEQKLQHSLIHLRRDHR